jgi:hypothetical protein
MGSGGSITVLESGNDNGCQQVKKSAHLEHQISEDPFQSGGVSDKANVFCLA